MRNPRQPTAFDGRSIVIRSIDGSPFKTEKGPNLNMLKGPDGVDSISDAGYIESGHKPKTNMALTLNFRRKGMQNKGYG
jgi:hypothetical protein